MRIAVIGAGAIGCLYGGYLARGGEEVWLVDVIEDHMRRINQKGLSVVAHGESFLAKPKATTIVDQVVRPVDLVIVCVKSPVTAEAVMIAEVLSGPHTIFLTLQNGIGNAEQLAEAFGLDRVIVGTTSMGSIVLEPGHIMYGGLKPTYLAAWNGKEEKGVQRLAAVLSRAGLPTKVADNALSLLWSKLTLHAGLNAVSAVTRVTNGNLIAMEETREFARLAAAEAEKVVRAAGIPLLFEDSFRELLDFAESMKDHRTSMLQDVMNGRRTEIDYINGAIVREGTRLGVPTPVNAALTLAIKTIERTY